MRLVAEQVACQRAGRAVFSGLSFSVGGGAALVLTGRNGAGKSSLLMMLAGLVEPAAGALRLEGATGERTLPEEAHYVGHRDALKPALTALESLEFWQAMLGRPAMAPAQALEEVGIGHAADFPCAWLSAGQRRRLALARLLVSARPVWLLDEPTSALDAASQDRFAALARTHLEGGGIVVAATHTPLGLPGQTELRLGGAA
jgi:heme exporter protein A